MKEFKLKNNKVLKIEQDSFDFNPRTEYDNLGKMICFHKRYDLGDKHDIKHSDYDSWEEMIKANTKKGDIVLPVYLYDHSGLSMSTQPLNCRWDSAQVGFIHLSKEQLRKEYGRATKKNIETATKVLIGEVETYNQYLCGDIYSFSILNEQGTVEDSCGGFFGSDLKTNGMLEHLSEEDRKELLQIAA